MDSREGVVQYNPQLRLHILEVSLTWSFYSLRKKMEDLGHRIVEVLASSNMAEQQAKVANLDQQDSQTTLWDDTANAQRVNLRRMFESKGEEAQQMMELTGA